jgi:hypothetical protein
MGFWGCDSSVNMSDINVDNTLIIQLNDLESKLMIAQEQIVRLNEEMVLFKTDMYNYNEMNENEVNFLKDKIDYCYKGIGLIEDIIINANASVKKDVLNVIKNMKK